jgi:hypothetical protein
MCASYFTVYTIQNKVTSSLAPRISGVHHIYVTNLKCKRHRAILGNIFEGMNVSFTPVNTVLETNHFQKK